ncbi:MAG: hypothetical protein PHY45_15265 [Rhodocyclaceae bacterium]|nr:hypothetical protein [Rhodocyclaceae bacterium]
MKIPPAILAAALLAFAAVPGRAAADSAAAPAPRPSKPMNMDEPMATGMKKPGMKNGDVKAAAARNAARMKALMARERERRAAKPPPAPQNAPPAAH